MQSNPEFQELDRWLPLSIVVLLVLSFIFVVLGLFGYSRLTVNVPAGDILKLNGRVYHNGTWRIHSGDYRISIISPVNTVVDQKFSIAPFQSKTITESSIPKRDPSAIVNSVIGAYSGYGAAKLYSAKFFQNNTWLAGLLEPGASQPVALHYQNNSWSMIYYGDPGYSHDTSALPGDVRDYVNQLLAEISHG